MLKTKRTDSVDLDFIALVQKLDCFLSGRDSTTHSVCTQYNSLDTIKYAIVVYDNEIAIACGAIREYAPGVIEIKRMFVDESVRGRGLASQVLSELEKWAKELGYNKAILETGLKMPEAISLYKKNGYTQIPNYGQYECIGGSICFAKELTDK